MNPLDFNEFLHGNHETSTPNKFSNDINPSIQMKMLLKNKSLDSQHKEFIKRKIKNIEANGLSSNENQTEREKNLSTSKTSRKVLENSPSTEAKRNFPSPFSKNQYKIEALLDIIKKKDYEIEKLQRLVRTKNQYIQTMENMLKNQKEVKSRKVFQEETEKLEFLQKKNKDIIQKAEEINYKLDTFQTPIIKKQIIHHHQQDQPTKTQGIPIEIYDLQIKISELENEKKRIEDQNNDLISLTMRLTSDCQTYINASKTLISEQKSNNQTNNNV